MKTKEEILNEISKAMTDKELASKILDEYTSDMKGLLDFGGYSCVGVPYENALKAMQAYHEAKIKEVTDEDIEMWANSKEKIIDEMPETLKLHITKKIECRIDGAKAFRDGEIKHKDNG